MSMKKITDVLGLRPLEEAVNESTEIETRYIESVDVPPLPSTVAQDEIICDIERAQNNINDIIDKGKHSFDELMSIAIQSQNPRAFEVVSTMMKTLIDANKDAVSMSEKKKYAKEELPQGQSTTNVTNNNLIISTADMLKMLKGGDVQ